MKGFAYGINTTYALDGIELKMSVVKLVEIVLRSLDPNGIADRRYVKETYGAGFEGAICDAASQGLVTDAADMGCLYVSGYDLAIANERAR